MGTAVTYKNVGRAPVGETLVLNTMSTVTNPFVKHGLMVEGSSGTTVNYMLNYIRPVYKIVEQAFTGYVEGLFNADIKNPVYCLTDGMNSLSTSFTLISRIFDEEDDPFNSIMWLSVADSKYLLSKKCNLLNSGATSMTALFF